MHSCFTLRTFSPEILQKNLVVLEEHRPSLFHRIQDLLESDSLWLRRNEQGTVECAVDPAFAHPLVTCASIEAHIPTLEEKLSSLSPCSEMGLLFVAGWDLGYTFKTIVERYLRKSLWKVAVVVEPDIRLFAASLAIHPLQEEIAKNRYLFVLGDHWPTQLDRLIQEEHLFTLTRIEAVQACPREQEEQPLLRMNLQQTAHQAMHRYRQMFHQEIASASLYYQKKDPSQIQKIMAMDFSGGMAVSYIHRRFLDECETQGMEVVYHTPSLLGGISLVRALAQERPDCLVTVNFIPGLYAPIGLLDQFQLPRFIWFLDDPQNFLEGDTHFGTNDFIFTWDFSYHDFLVSYGAQSVDHFPFVADLDHTQATFRDSLHAPISFIGQVGALVPSEFGLDASTVQFVKQAGREKGIAPERSYESIVLELQEEFGLHIIASEHDVIPRNIHYAMYVVGNSARRIHILERLIPYGLKLYGNRSWEKVLGDHPLRDCYVGPADPKKDVPDIFLSSEINLNIHSLHAVTSLNQRDFNCPLVGGFLLTDWVEGADSFFVPDTEMVFYRDVDELEEKVKYYLQHPDERKEIIEKGRERVLRDHTYPVRVPRIIDTFKKRIRERYSSKPSPLTKS